MDLPRSPRLWLLTVALAVVFVASAWNDGELHAWTDGILIAANVAPLLLVGRNPLAVTSCFAGAYPLWLAWSGSGADREGHFLQALPTLVAIYATGQWARPLWLRASALLLPVWMIAAALLGLWDTDVLELSFVAVVFGVVWLLGVVVGARREQAEVLQQRTVELEFARHELAENAVAAERARIARELHDVVAHAMSVITVQAGVGGQVISSRPERAAESLGIIERTGREALAELRRTLVVLRDPSAGDELAPQPGIDQLPSLLTSVRSAGVAVELRREGAPVPLPPGLELAVYRVVQEGLTNITKHAGAAKARVRLTYQPARLVVEVQDSGSSAPTRVVRGHGLTGMAERVGLYDGTLTASGGPNGFRVAASFPLDRPAGGTA